MTKTFPEKPIYLGGIYVKLCEEHLRNFTEKHYKNYPIYIVTQDLDEFVSHLQKEYSPSGNPHFVDYPIFDMQTKIPYVILTYDKYGLPI